MKKTEKVSYGNFNEKIYSVKNFPTFQFGETNRIEYENPAKLTSYFESHPAYFSDYMAFQHLELWLSGLTLKNNQFRYSDSKIPLVFSCRMGGNYQKLIGPINLYLGNIAYHISDFKTQEEIASSEILINKKNAKGLLPYIFKSEKENNFGYQKNLSLSMANNFLDKNLFEVKIIDPNKKLSGRLLFQTSSEERYAEVYNSGDEKFPIKEIMTKKWAKLIGDRSLLKYGKQSVDFSRLESNCFIDESRGFPIKKKNWDWTIFKSYPNQKENVWLIMRKKCKRAGYPIVEEEIATLSVNGKIHRLKGEVLFNYDVTNLKNPWLISFADGRENIIGETNEIAPLIEKSFLHKKIGPIKVDLDLQRIIAETKIKIRLNNKQIEVKGIGSFESNKGMERGTRYFKE